ncbi:MAG TPA: GIDE domain-containing protein [Steroidobacteraceae bacterium]|nr:GIDE domain-containing protein [Steroidobacteraceae bacterium]
MADDELWFGLLMLALAVVAGGAAALRWIRLARLIEDTPTSRIRSAAQGYVELAGRALALADTQNLAPLTQRPCVWWRYRISKKVESGSGRHRRRRWQTVASGRSSLPFLLDDGTGQCIVNPDGAQIVTTETTTWYGHTPWPTTAPGGSGPWFSGGRDYRYVEERIYEHERVHALGDFRSSASNTERDLQAGQAALLSEWKQDQPELVRRFDEDRDGRIDLAEWDQAREAARRTVYERQAERPERVTLHVLSKPDDQLFLLASLPPGDLVKRYRRRALLAFAGFVVAVYALGWLIQDAFG